MRKGPFPLILRVHNPNRIWMRILSLMTIYRQTSNLPSGKTTQTAL
jgi:hypothetical protein